MKHFPGDITFKFPWRSYQERVLEELDAHLDDNHLNIVAAPGSGKTVLGLEVVLRLNKPTLVLAPSIAIRNQWVSRFVDLFLQAEKSPSWISKDIKKPGFLTVSTYQGLHAAFTGKKEEEEEPENNNNNDTPSSTLKTTVIDTLKRRGLKTIVVDEAHHLRSAWWKSLIFLKDNISKPTVVALTATPPYDVPPMEWRRYQDLCGPVDAEISVPELVLEKNLCPHQDYVYLNSLSAAEDQQVKTFRNNVKTFLDVLTEDVSFIEALENHPCIKDPEAAMEDILDNPEYFSSMAIFLNARGKKIPGGIGKILGVSRRRIPPFTLEWAEILLTHFLYRDGFCRENYKELIPGLRRQLKQIGAIEGKKVLLRNNPGIEKLLRESPDKLDSIARIVELERKNLGDRLRMVILTDYIRREFFPGRDGELMPMTRIGVAPIFEKIRRENGTTVKAGILSGSLVVVPASALPILEKAAGRFHIPAAHLKTSPLAHDDGFVQVEVGGESNQKVVQLITRVFSLGGIEVLVGTKSLLGEGWDAPSVNSLILASFVGSFMLSNQMRGRAIRTLASDPGKTANIWHLVSVETGNSYAGQDFDTLERRFKAFVGLSFKGDVIENGFERMDLGHPPFSKAKIERLNERTREHALRRDKLRDDWQRVLSGGVVRQVIPEIKTARASLPRRFVFFNTIYALFWRSLMLGGYFFLKTLEVFKNRLLREETIEGLLYFLAITGIIAFLITLPGLFKALYLFLRNGPVASNMKQIAAALLKTLCKMGAIKTEEEKLKVIAGKDRYGIVYCALEGGSSYEKSLFLDCLEELVNPVENPRYILIRKSVFKWIQRRDFHTVPGVIGARKEWAAHFSTMWKKYVGPNRLIYTRHYEGRGLLLIARQRALAAGFQKRSERVSAWK
jgi:superfamily II DNA or RNA helicase